MSPIRHLPAAGLVSVTALAVALPAMAAPFFNRISSFPVAANLPADAKSGQVTSAEIISASGDGKTLVYTDSPNGAIGFIDITDPSAPKPLGSLGLGGEPTSVTIRDRTAFVAVNTGENRANPDGKLVTVDIGTRAVGASCTLGGQPNSIAVSPDGSFLAIAIENERDEEVNGGAVPQLPAGWLAIVPLKDGVAACDGMIRADLTKLAEIAPDDPEPEFVDINASGEIAVTLQENNAIVVLDRTGKVLSHVSAGTVDINGVDLSDDGRIAFTEAKAGVRREPDAIHWIGTEQFATANEGDWKGGSRSFTIWNRDGTVAYESGNSFEQAAAAAGHYPDKRSDAKGIEPEGLQVARFGDSDYLFVLAERASVVEVYHVGTGAPDLVQILPSGVSPERGVAIPARNLFVTANEADLGEDGGARSHVMIYALQDTSAPFYPTLTSAGSDPLIGWGALSGLSADPDAPGHLHAVSDGFYGKAPTIFTIDATVTPARITGATVVKRDGEPAQKLDLEGITSDGEDGFWLVSEGRTDRLVPHALLRVDANGEIDDEIAFPASLLAGETRYGAEGVALVGNTVWIAIQREWADDPKGTVKLLAYDPDTEEWGTVRYPLDPAPDGGWMGISEIAANGDFLYVLERDNQVGTDARVKQIARIPLSELNPAAIGEPIPTVKKEVVRDLLPDLGASGGYILDKVEGLAIDDAGDAYIVTDNDGVNDSSGETLFLRLGPIGN